MLLPKTPSSQSPPSTPQWRPLPPFPNLPPLLISAHFSANSYAIHLTDLSTIWTESLDKKGILKRSLTEDTSIDLMDADAEQWGVFLGKLGSAFDVRNAEYARTSLSLRSMEAAGRSFGSSLGGSGDGDLVLNITCILPEPLEPLRWPVLLKKCSPSATAERLTLPLVRDRARVKRDVDDLVERLREKDVIITKLVDKLETMGVGLENVFHVLSGKRKTSRAMAEEKVKGLRAFGEGQWRRERMGEGDMGAGDVSEVITKSFGVEGDGEGAPEPLIEVSSQLDDWWMNLGSEVVMAEKNDDNGVNDASTGGKKTTLPGGHSTKSSGQADDDDDDFQVQSTPPHIQAATAQKKRIAPKPPKPRWRRDESSDDDDDVSIPDSHPVPPVGKGASQDHSASQSSRTVPVHDDDTASSGSELEAKKPAVKMPLARKGGLGAIGRKQKAPTPEAEPVEKQVSPPETRSKAPSASENKANDLTGDEDDLTASGSDSDTSMKGSKSKAAIPPAPPKRAGLGRIGAKEMASAPSQRQESPTSAPTEDKEHKNLPAKATRLHDHNKDDGDDAMDTDATKSHESSPAPAVGTKPAASKPAGRKTLGTIGKIGARKQTPSATSAPSMSAAAKAGEEEEAQDAAKKRARNDSATPTARSATASSKAQDEDEDAEQRAERKRAELARELEKKAAAPAKKKRRF